MNSFGNALLAYPTPGSTPTARAHLDTWDGCPVLHVAGELDLAVTDSLSAALQSRLDRCPTGEVLLDLSAVSFCDCVGLRALLRAQAHAAGRGQTLRLHGASQAVLRILELTDCRHLFGLPAGPAEESRAWSGSRV